MNARLAKSLAWVFFLAALGWIILLSVAAGHIYLTREMPIGFWNWVASIQVRGTDDWPKPKHHTNAYYLVRFFAPTGILELLGIWGGIHLWSSTSRSVPVCTTLY